MEITIPSGVIHGWKIPKPNGVDGKVSRNGSLYGEVPNIFWKISMYPS
jgi:hypothetical protein